MQRFRSSSKAFVARRGTFGPLHQVAATMVLAFAGSLLQPAAASPYGHLGGMPATGDIGGMLMAHPRQMERLLGSIGASAEQRAQIDQIAQAVRADLRVGREAGRGLHEHAQALFAQPVVDEAAAESLRQQMLARHEEASKRMLQAMLEASRVLTPEQRKIIAGLAAQRRATFERQRVERDAAGGASR